MMHKNAASCLLNSFFFFFGNLKNQIYKLIILSSKIKFQSWSKIWTILSHSAIRKALYFDTKETGNLPTAALCLRTRPSIFLGGWISSHKDQVNCKPLWSLLSSKSLFQSSRQYLSGPKKNSCRTAQNWSFSYCIHGNSESWRKIIYYMVNMPCETPVCHLQFYEAQPCEEKELPQKPTSNYKIQ